MYNCIIRETLCMVPAARAEIKGLDEHPCISGTVLFYQTVRGVFVTVDVTGLPCHNDNDCCKAPFFGFHIHDCNGHYNPHNCLHPHHAGDMPPLLGNHGRAVAAFLTDRFSVNEIIGKITVIHAFPDDFTTQPSGNSGKMIATGCIKI